MKKMILFLVVLSFIFGTSSAKEFWEELYSQNDIGSFYIPQIKYKNSMLFVTNSSKLCISNDSGKSWDFNKTNFNGNIHCYDISPSGEIFVAFGDGLWKSIDNGQTYYQISANFFNTCIQSIYIKEDGTIYLHSWEKFAKSTDNGVTWKISIIEPNPEMERWNTLRLLKNGFWILQSDFGNLMKSTDDGLTWEQIHLIIDNREIPFLINRVNKEDVIYAIVDTSQDIIVKSTDYGNTWKFVYHRLENYKFTEICPLSNGELLIGASKDKYSIFHLTSDKKTLDITNNLELNSEIISIVETNDKIFLAEWYKSIYLTDKKLIMKNMFLANFESNNSVNEINSYKSINFDIYVNDENSQPLKGANIEIKNFYTREHTKNISDTNSKVSHNIFYDLSINNIVKYIIEVNISYPNYYNTFNFRKVYNIGGIQIESLKKDFNKGDIFEINLKPYIKQLNNERSDINDVNFMVFSPFTSTFEFLKISNTEITNYLYVIPEDALPGKYEFQIYAYKEGYIFKYATEEIRVRTTTEVEYHSLENDFANIFPNPASEYIEIMNHRVNPMVQEMGVEIYNALGECVKSPQPQPFSQWEKGVRVDVSDLPVGIYFVRFGYEYLKFVKI